MLGLEDLYSGRARKQAKDAAPVFEIPPRPVIAIEHPCIIKNLDKGIQSFGPNPDFQKLFNGEVPRPMLPMWLRPDALMSKPIMSHAAASNNVLLKITVPKRTGRKRKRGSNEPFSGDVTLGEAGEETPSSSQVCSVGRQDKPVSLLRKLRDNAGNYEAEAVGSIKESHRYRGLADFQFAVEGFPTVQNIAEHLMPMQASKLRDFKFDTSLETGPGQEILPPPHFTDKVVPFNYFYDQNPFVRAEGLDENGKPIIVNINRKKANYGHYIPYNQYPVPEAPLQPMAPHLEQIPKELLSKVKEALDERPIWTRRALINRVGPISADTHIKIAIATYGYQFKGGPWRDAVIKYGIDPRSDAKYRHFQTLAFKLHKLPKLSKISNGHAKTLTEKELSSSHIWDGESYCTNGKFWQICDITDPVLVKMIEKAPLLSECDINDGGFWPLGFWAKVKAFMKAKMIAIRAGRYGPETDNPKRKGVFYTSDLVAKLNEYPDVLGPNGRSALTVHTLLYGLEDVSGLEGLRYRHRPISQYSNPYAALGFGEGGQRKRYKTKGRLAHGAATDADEGDKGSNAARGPDFPDDAWAHILDSDLSGSGEDDGDADGDDADETTMLGGGRGPEGPAMGNDSDDEM